MECGGMISAPLTALFPIADPAELRARLRSLRLAARILCGPRACDLERALADAERDPAAIVRAVALIERLAPLDRHREGGLANLWGLYPFAPPWGSRADSPPLVL
jgi:hypothetical protein